MRFYFSRIAAVLVLGFGLYWVFESITGAGRRPVTLSSAGEVVTEKLADGSTVSLNIKSQLTYPKSFSRDQRSVSLQGEAFFEVEPNPRQPFVIEVDGAVVKVLGTSFYVKAYDSLSEVTIGVQEGRVEVMPESADRPVILEKGESLSVSKASAEVTPQPFEPNEVYWKSKTLIFQNEHLSEVFSTLEGLYGVNIEVENKDILNCSLTAKFYSEDIEQILEIVNTNFNLTSTHEDNHILISGGGCD